MMLLEDIINRGDLYVDKTDFFRRLCVVNKGRSKNIDKAIHRIGGK